MSVEVRGRRHVDSDPNISIKHQGGLVCGGGDGVAVVSQRLNESLELHHTATHHRALSDAITTAKLFLMSLELVDEKIETVEDLILFSKQGKRFKRPKFDPLLDVAVET